MGRAAYKCCVERCINKGGISHRFPNPKLNCSLLQQWIQIIGPEQFRDISVDMIHYKKRICSFHFEDKCYSPGTKVLNYNAVPSLNLFNNVNTGDNQKTNKFAPDDNQKTDDFAKTCCVKSIATTPETTMAERPNTQSIIKSVKDKSLRKKTIAIEAEIRQNLDLATMLVNTRREVREASISQLQSDPLLRAAYQRGIDDVARQEELAQTALAEYNALKLKKPARH